ncbi:MAG: AAA family ATPase [Desulfobulbaceae bacterium]|uniref:AAA family ATPase n=1 Tax=Candidatus Desulfobia pelagia TaxID=2841692 RepID=A0A8J6ND10_9BACT|nr:AAA family ATPase [Candidatus Desulfobia pelagia]
MYEEYFGFTSLPFSIAPNPHYLFMSERHREALAHLLYGIRSESGFVLLTGEVGTGKTTICRCLLEQVPEDTDIAFIFNPKLTVEELLATICEEFGIDQQEKFNSIKVFVDHINSFLLRSHAKGRKAVLIIDEAQNLSVDVLEQIRLLTNLETNERKLLQIIMLGQPELKEMLQRPELRQLAQRITARYHLEPLSQREVGSYVAHRLTIAEGRSKIFPPSTLKLLYQLSKGTPRLINIICDRALLGTYVHDQDQVSTSILKKAAREVFGDIDDHPQKNRKRSYWSLAAMFLLFSGSVLAAAYYYQNPQIGAFFIQESVSQVDVLDKVEPITPIDHVNPVGPVMELKEGDMAEPVEPVMQMEMVGLEGQAMPVAMLETPGADGDEPGIQIEISETDIRVLSRDISPLEWPGDKSIKESAGMAYTALFASWQVPYIPGSGTSVCSFAESHNLRCLDLQGSLDSLVDLNRPAVLTLYDDKGDRFFAALTAFHGQTATLVIGSEEKIVTIEDIGSRWFGEYSLLWTKPLEYISAIKPGDTAVNVEWLDKKLAFIQGRSPSSQNPITFNSDLANQVKQFQFSRNLVPDGIVGPQTIIHLNSACGINVPKLIDIPEDK